jgi:very-short-patch-repair endonuclease
MSKKIEIAKEYLEFLYSYKKLNCYEIASILKIGKTSVLNKLKAYKIPLRNPWHGRKRVEITCDVCGTVKEIAKSRNKNGRRKFCSRRCKGIYEFMKKNKYDTSLEKSVQLVLDKLGVKYVKQCPIHGITLADFYIPEQRLVIQADGKYWHSLPGAKERDTRQDFLLMFNGYKILRLAEDVVSNSIKTKNLIKSSLRGGKL